MEYKGRTVKEVYKIRNSKGEETGAVILYFMTPQETIHTTKDGKWRTALDPSDPNVSVALSSDEYEKLSHPQPN